MTDQKKEKETKKKKYPHYLEFWLVLVMLGVLTLLLLGIMVFFPLLAAGKVGGPECNQQIIDYSKWIVTALLAAFGAWIGAGAAYFFGKANLVESSRSTEAALEIQRDSLRGRRGLKYIEDLNLTTMNKNFLFTLKNTAQDVANGLNTNVGYWFVPVTDEKGVLQDVIHAQIFWSKRVIETETLEKITADLDKEESLKDLKKLHGEVFYSTVKLNDTIKEVYELMKEKNNAVAIVVDNEGKPTHCLTRTDLGSIIQTKENE